MVVNAPVAGMLYGGSNKGVETVFGARVAIDAFVRALCQHGRLFHFELLSDAASIADTVREVDNCLVSGGIQGGSATVVLDRHALCRFSNYRFKLWHDVNSDVVRPMEIRQAFSTSAYPITITHHTISYQEMIHTWYLRLLLGTYRSYDSVVCSTVAARTAIASILERLEATFNRSYGTKLAYPGRFDVIPLGVDVELYRPRDKQEARYELNLPGDATIILWMGRLSPTDKADLLPLLTVFQRLAEEHAEEKLLLICVGTDRPQEHYAAILEEYARELGVARQVLIKKPPVPDLPYLWLAAADIFVSPVDSIQESFGLTPVEAMACGIPQVVSDWNGYRETVQDGVTGFRVPTYSYPCDADLVRSGSVCGWERNHLSLAQSTVVDQDELFRHLRALTVNRELRSRMAANSRRRAVEEFSWKRVIGLYEALWEDLSTRAEHDGSEGSRISYERLEYFRAFEHYSTRVLSPEENVRITKLGEKALSGEAGVPSYLEVFKECSVELAVEILRRLQESGGHDQMAGLVRSVAEFNGIHDAVASRHILWLLKYGLLAAEGHVNHDVQGTEDGQKAGRVPEMSGNQRDRGHRGSRNGQGTWARGAKGVTE